MSIRNLGMKTSIFAASAALAAAALPAHVKVTNRSGDIQAGRALAQANCSGCHVVVPRPGAVRSFTGAPDFADIAQRPGTTRRSLHAFLRSPHPIMPSPVVPDREANDVIAYILSLKQPGKP